VAHNNQHRVEEGDEDKMSLEALTNYVYGAPMQQAQAPPPPPSRPPRKSQSKPNRRKKKRIPQVPQQAPQPEPEPQPRQIWSYF
jgi:hypothetical protein